ncbi:MAG TPA: PQQ-dependent sugar dehydrogenase [Hyphomicrobiales bacterium]|nr:PQQ-dependent sugar dehydrogenase [Hyphomicrobiales bacterium]
MPVIHTWGSRLALHVCLFMPLSLLAAAAPPVDPLADPPVPAFMGQTQAPAPAAVSKVQQQVIASGFESPRSLVALPDGVLLVAEGEGRVRILSAEGQLSEPLAGMPELLSVGGRGIGDFVLDADFANNRRVFFSYLAPAPGQKAGPRSAEDRNRALERGEPFQLERLASARLSEDFTRLENVQTIAEVWGRRLLSAPDGTLYVSTMAFDLAIREQRPLAQNIKSPRGKVLRFNADGSIPADNPFVNRPGVEPALYTVGHRDPDGLALHPLTGDVWEIEHGPMGGDEVNRLTPGANYGWPLVTYGKNYDGSRIGYSSLYGIEEPRYYWYPSVAPSGLLFYTGSLFPDWQGNLFLGTMSPTQGKFLVRLVLDDTKVVAEEHLLADNDRRIRALAQGADGALYVLTDSENDPDGGRQFAGEVIRLTP